MSGHVVTVIRFRRNDYVGPPIWGYRPVCVCGWTGSSKYRAEEDAQREADGHGVVR